MSGRFDECIAKEKRRHQRFGDGTTREERDEQEEL